VRPFIAALAWVRESGVASQTASSGTRAARAAKAAALDVSAGTSRWP
jgi:hypothetical protein